MTVSTNGDHASTTAGRALVVGAIVVCLGSVAGLVAPGWCTERICRGILPPGADLQHAECLVRVITLCGLAWSLMLFAWSRLAGRLSYSFVRAWCMVGSVALYVGASLSFWWYVDDDAGISFTYARNLVHGYGLVLNPGGAAVEGFSNPLWVLVLAMAEWSGLDIVSTAKTLGILFGAACVVLVHRAMRGQHPLCWLALPLTACNAPFIIWNNSGLETSLHALLLLALVLLLSDHARSCRPRPRLIAVLCLLVVSRPEGAIFALAAGVYLAIHRSRRNESVWPAMVTLALPWAVLAGLTMFRLLYFDDVLPNTFYAKASLANPLRLLNPFSGGWSYVGKAAAACGWTVAAVPLLLLCASYKTWTPLVSGALAVLAAQLFFVVSVGGDWMAEFRFIAPIAPIVICLVAMSLTRLWEVLSAALSRRNWVGLAICLAPTLLIGFSQLPRLIVFAHHPTTPMATVAGIGLYFKELARRAGIDNPTLLYHDVGGSSYVAKMRLIDLGGLCDRTIAKHRHDRARIRRYLFHQERPTFIYSSKTFSDRIGLEEFPEFQTDYVPLPPAPSAKLDGYIRRVRRDLYPKISANDQSIRCRGVRDDTPAMASVNSQ